MKNVSNETLALIDKLVLQNYPKARKVDPELLDGYAVGPDGFYPIAHYIIKDIPGADELGFDDESKRSQRSQIVAVRFEIDDETGRIFFWNMNNYGEPDATWGASNGELVDGKLVFEFGRENEMRTNFPEK